MTAATASVLDQFRLDGRTALVTGAGRGIGWAFAEALQQAGAAVACVDVDGAAAAAAAQRLQEAGGRALAVAADVSDAADCERMVAAAVAAWGRLDVAVNNAGVASWAAAEELSEADWDRTCAINLKGVFLGAQAQARVMLAQGRGAIVNTASMSARIVNHPQQQSAYNASKAGVVHLTRSLAAEWAGRGVRVNAISPGYIETPLTRQPEIAELKERWTSDIPIGRLGTTDELKGALVFLASDASSYATGLDLLVDGGFCCW